MQASAWFQVSCPMCTAALQVELSAGFNDVQCSLVLECKQTFRVYLPPERLQNAVEPTIWRRPEVMHAPSAALQAYRSYMHRELLRLKQEQPNLHRTERMKVAGAQWATAAENPAVQPAATAMDEDTTAPAGADAEADHDEAPPAARVAGRERSGLRLGGRGRQFGGAAADRCQGGP